MNNSEIYKPVPAEFNDTFCENCKNFLYVSKCKYCPKKICPYCRTLCFDCGELIFYCCLTCGCETESNY